eukprot:851743-Pelagomonas_calceolata.AAC.1
MARMLLRPLSASFVWLDRISTLDMKIHAARGGAQCLLAFLAFEVPRWFAEYSCISADNPRSTRWCTLH